MEQNIIQQDLREAQIQIKCINDSSYMINIFICKILFNICLLLLINNSVIIIIITKIFDKFYIYI